MSSGSRESGSSRGGRGSVRIGAGRWRGRRVPVVAAEGLRPTGDRVRETLFNWLRPQLPGARVADLFAGTGILGLEALSRGAASALFVEREPRLAAAIRERLAAFGHGGSRVITADVYGLLAAGGAERFDIVFLDPPYADDRLAELCTLLRGKGWLTCAALVYLEHDRRHVPDLPPKFEIHRQKRAGNVGFVLLRSPAA